MNRITRTIGRAMLLLVAALFPLGQTAAPQELPMGVVRGVVQTTQGKAIGGFWLIIDNPDLGVNYRKDVNPIGQFEFTDIYPGPYVFRISPDSYTIVSPAKIQVQGGRTMTVTVKVTRTPEKPAGGAKGPKP